MVVDAEREGTAVERPEGLRDMLPAEAWQRRRLERQLRRTFAAWGYRELRTPVLEPYQVVRRAGFNGDARTFKVIDPEGRILALRPDMTTAIARVVADRLADATPPLRLCYVAELFRLGVEPGEGREFTQAGLELIGSTGALADSEVLILAAEALAAVGLERCQLAVGHVGLLQAVLDAVGLGAGQQAAVRRALQGKDYVALEQAFSVAGEEDGTHMAFLSRLLHFRGEFALIRPMVRKLRSPEVEAHLAHLERVWAALAAAGLDDLAYIDLGLVRDLDYYTGLVFELYREGVGQAVGVGGRYDRLLARFGRPAPAIGFALDLEILSRALGLDQAPQAALPAPEIVLAAAGEETAPVMAEAGRLRGTGRRIQLLLEPVEREQALAAAKALGAGELRLVGRETERITWGEGTGNGTSGEV